MRQDPPRGHHGPLVAPPKPSPLTLALAVTGVMTVIVIAFGLTPDLDPCADATGQPVTVKMPDGSSFFAPTMPDGNVSPRDCWTPTNETLHDGDRP